MTDFAEYQNLLYTVEKHLGIRQSILQLDDSMVYYRYKDHIRPSQKE